MPDLPAILMVVWALRVAGDTPAHVFGTLYFSEAWQAILGPTHSFPLWGAALIVALWLRSATAQAFFASGLFHSICDFFLHHDDPHRHFWPLSDWRFASPVSYWDPAHYGDVFRLVELGMVAAAILYLLARHRVGAELSHDGARHGARRGRSERGRDRGSDDFLHVHVRYELRQTSHSESARRRKPATDHRQAVPDATLSGSASRRPFPPRGLRPYWGDARHAEEDH
ncbi:MAG: hypothetical protein ACOVOI_12300, partial [Hyphomicrobiales bacterium]